MPEFGLVWPVPGDGGSVAEVLAQLLHATSGRLALIASRQGRDFLVEEASPQPDLAGTRLRIPGPADAAAPLRLESAGIRLPLDWTLACKGRPDYVMARPLGAGALHLVLAGAGPLPGPGALDPAADRLAAILAAGGGTRRDLELARYVRDLVDHLPFPVVFIDSRSFDALANDPARRLLGLADPTPAAGAVPLALRALVAASGIDLAQALPGDRGDRVFDLAHAERQFEVTIRTIERDRLVGRLWVFRDVTAERQAARFKDELIANVSHELRTPLTSITGALALLKRELEAAASPDVGRLLTIANSNARRLGRLVDDLLEADRFEAGQLEFLPRAVDLGRLLAETIDLHTPYAERHGVQFAYAPPGTPCIVRVDPDRMAQVIGNVLSNAAKFSPRGAAVQIGLECAGRRARIRISDRGPGMTPEFQRRLFTRFARERGASGRQPGTGLGLSIAKGLVEAMGGTIAVSSAVGRGTRVTIAVPMAEAAPDRA